MRLKEVEQASGIRFNWRPFHLLIILQEMKHVPFADKPAKAAYMWRDIERRATMYGIPAALPAPYPAKQSIVANLVATVGMRQGWGTDFVRAAYRRWFQLGHETGSEPNVSESLREIGQEPQSVLALANAADTKNALGPARVDHSVSRPVAEGCMGLGNGRATAVLFARPFISPLISRAVKAPKCSVSIVAGARDLR